MGEIERMKTMSASTEKQRRMEEQLAKKQKKAELQREAEEKAKKSQMKWRLGMAAIAVFMVLSIVLNTSLPFRMTAVKVGSDNLSAAEMNYFYSNEYYRYYEYMAMFGVDTSMPLEDQECILTEEGSWKDFLMDEAMNTAKSMYALYNAAVAEGFELSEAGKEEVEHEMEHLPEYAQNQGFSSVKKYLRAGYGSGVTEELVRDMMAMGTLVNEYANAKAETFTYTESEIEAFYMDNVDSFREYDLHYYYIAAETEEVTDEEGNTTSEVVEGGVEAALEAAEALAANVTDEASFDAAVAAYKEGATVSHTHGYVKSSLNAAFRDWAADASRTAGDVTAVSNENGAYVVLYVGYDDNMYPSTAMRHILVKSVDEDGDGSYSEEESAAAKAKIEEIEAEWLASDKTEETFAALANEYSEDEGSNTVGGLYETIGMGDMVTEIDSFLFEEGRKAGDTAVLHGNNGSYDGYHLVYFVGEGQLYGLAQAESQMLNDAYTEWETGITEGVTAETAWAARLIGK